jgi:hypothetical protein
VAIPPYTPDFSETPPFAYISGVQWNMYRLVAYYLAQNGDGPQYFIQWAGPKPYYSEGELKELERNGQRTQVPVFGVRQTVYTGSVSLNGTYSFPTGFPPVPIGHITISGDFLHSNPPGYTPDSRGYVKLDGFDMVVSDNGLGSIAAIPVDHPGSEYWDYHGVKIDVADYPPIPVLDRGRSIASDEQGSVFVYQRPLDTSKRGITKYHSVTGEVLWKVAPDGSFDTVRYDETTQRIYVYYFFLPETSTPGIEVYNLNGAKQSTVDFGDEYTAEDVSRNGKHYVTGPAISDDHEDTIHCFGPTGAPLWTIPGEDLSEVGSNFWGPITAYGEDYLVVEIQQNLEAPPAHAVTQRHHGYRIYNAHTGALVSSGETADDISTSEETSGGGFETFTEHNSISYGRTLGMVRGAYWP